jgi:hypothetical protein
VVAQVVLEDKVPTIEVLAEHVAVEMDHATAVSYLRGLRTFENFGHFARDLANHFHASKLRENADL